MEGFKMEPFLMGFRAEGGMGSLQRERGTANPGVRAAAMNGTVLPWQPEEASDVPAHPESRSYITGLALDSQH